MGRMQMPRWSTSAAGTLASALALSLAACSPHKAPVTEFDASEVVPGLIEVEVRGASAGARQLVAGLGEIADEGVFEEDDTDFFLPRETFAETIFLVRTGDDPARAAAALAALRARPEVIYAEPVVKLHAFSWTPDDPGFAKQWHLRAAGAPGAWESSRGEGATVAVIDTGIAAVDDLDQDRLLPGRNFVPGGREADATDDHGHGTHVAGTVAQSTGNGKGVAGMAPRARLLPLKVLDASGGGTSAGIEKAIRYAADHGAQVLNLSLGGGARSEGMARAVEYARRKGCLVVAAAGNAGVRHVSYPAAYDGALAVSAVGPEGRIAPYSSFGPEIALGAPGGDKSQGEERGVLQQTLGEDGKPAYLWFQGTSMATPHVAGAAALLYAAGVTDPGAVRRLLQSSARAPASLDAAGPVGHQRPSASEKDLYGAGLLDAGAALRTATLWWGLARLALALGGAFFALAQARRLGQLRTKESPGAPFWTMLALSAGALAIAAPLGLARLSWASALALPPAGAAAHWLGLPGSSGLATGAAWMGWSATLPFLAALIARAVARGAGASSPLAMAVSGLCFGHAGVLLHAALVRSVHLPYLPALLTPFWLGACAVVAWGAGRALLAREGVR